MNMPYVAALVINERGFVLPASLFCLVVLSFIGIAAMNVANIEKTIARNVNLTEKTFYAAEGGTEAGIELLRLNTGCAGFRKTALDGDHLDPQSFHSVGGVEIVDPRLAYRETSADLPWKKSESRSAPFPSNLARSVRIPENMALASDDAPHTNLAIVGETLYGTGGAGDEGGLAAYQMGTSYENAPVSVGVRYQITSQAFGLLNSQSVIRLEWMQRIDDRGECRPY